MVWGGLEGGVDGEALGKAVDRKHLLNRPGGSKEGGHCPLERAWELVGVYQDGQSAGVREGQAETSRMRCGLALARACWHWSCARSAVA